MMMTTRLRKRRFQALIAVALAAGCTAPQPREQARVLPPPIPADPTPYLLAAGDVIEVKFPYKAEFNEKLPIRPDGCVSLQLVGDVRAIGLTPTEFAGVLNEKYAEWIRNPHATVIVHDFAPQRVFVGGEVATPGAVPLRGPMTCTQAILAKGGASRTGNVRQVILMRYAAGDRATVYELDLERIRAGEEPDVLLKAFDVLHVPMTQIAEIGEFVEQYINKLVPRALSFPYNLNTRVDVEDNAASSR